MKLFRGTDRLPPSGPLVGRIDRAWFLLVLLLLAHGVLLCYSAAFQSPTLNEPGHLATGIRNWELRKFEIYRVNPPLLRMIAAVPVLVVGCETDWKEYDTSPQFRPEFQLGEDFVAANGSRAFWLFTLARWACVPFSLIGGYVCYRWASELYAPSAGLLALAIWCFCPNILGHGQLLTPDVAATSLGLAACYTFWRWLKQPTWTKMITSGLILGLAELTKMTMIVFFVVWPVMWLVYRWPERRSLPRLYWLRELAMLIGRMIVALYILNLGYGFEGSFTPLGEYQFVSAALRGQSEVPSNRFAESWLGYVPMPVPKNYLLGMDLQRRDFEEYHHPSYLRGEFRKTGWWYYYLYALTIKVPLGTWLLAGIALVLRLRHGRPSVARRDEFVLLCPAIVILLLVSSQSGFSEHMRYVLPAFPFFFVWISQVGLFVNAKHNIVSAFAAGALAWSIVSSLLVYPHELSYFNELVGGPLGGPKHLIHSNVDWGQDILFLKSWLDEHPEAEPLKLAYFGFFDPTHAGIAYTAPQLPFANEGTGGTSEIPPGWYAISVNFVRGFPYFTYKGDGTKVSLEQNALAAFQQLEPVAMAGYSIYIYHVE